MKRKAILAMLMCGVMAGACGISTFAEEAAVETETASKYEIVEVGEKPEYNALDYVTVGDYKGLAVDVEELVVNEEDAVAEMEDALNYAIEEKELFTKGEGAVKDGDVANIDFVGKIDGNPFDGGTGEDYDLTIGSGSFIEGFEEQLVGVNTGDTVDVNVTFPEDYWTDDLAGKPAVFTVTVNYIKQSPEMTDALVADCTDGEYTTLEAYQEYMVEKLKEDMQFQQDAEIENELMTQLYNVCQVNEYPQELIDYSVNSARNYYIQMAEMYGMDYEELLSQFGMSGDEEFKEVLAEDVKESLMQEMILHAVAVSEGITISEDEYKEGAQGYVDSMGYASVEELEGDYSHDEIEEAILMKKTLDMVRDNAVISFVEPSTEDFMMFDDLEFEDGDFEIEYETDDEWDELFDDETEDWEEFMDETEA